MRGQIERAARMHETAGRKLVLQLAKGIIECERANEQDAREQERHGPAHEHGDTHPEGAIDHIPQGELESSRGSRHCIQPRAVHPRPPIKTARVLRGRAAPFRLLSERLRHVGLEVVGLDQAGAGVPAQAGVGVVGTQRGGDLVIVHRLARRSS